MYSKFSENGIRQLGVFGKLNWPENEIIFKYLSFSLWRITYRAARIFSRKGTRFIGMFATVVSPKFVFRVNQIELYSVINNEIYKSIIC